MNTTIRNLLLFSTAVSLCLTYSLHAVIVRGEIWRKQRDDGSYQYVYGMYDYHLGVANAYLGKRFPVLFELAVKQASTVMDNLKKISLADSLVLFEDSSIDCNGVSIFPTGFLKLQELSKLKLSGAVKNELLSLIYDSAKKYNIEAINVEVRQKYFAAQAYDDLMQMAMLISQHVRAYTSVLQFNVDELQGDQKESILQMQKLVKMDKELLDAGLTRTNLLQYDKALNVTVGNIVDDIDAVVNKTKSWQDGELLTEYYAQQSKLMYMNGKTLFDSLKNARDMTYEAFIKKWGEKGPDIAGILPRCFSEMVDVYAMHEIYRHMNNKKKICLIAGGAHVKNILSIMKSLGYERVNEAGMSDTDIPAEVYNEKIVDDLIHKPSGEINTTYNED